jgi:hypothetical protein
MSSSINIFFSKPVILPKKAQEHIRVSSALKDKPLAEYRDEDFRTLYDVLPIGVKLSGNGACLGYRKNGKGPFVWNTYSELIEQTRYIGSGLLNKEIQAENTTNIGIYSRNRPEVVVNFHFSHVFLHFFHSGQSQNMPVILIA